jgi:hypothetical protein
VRIVEPGDLYASHSGSTGELRIGGVDVRQYHEQEISEERLRPWIQALDKMDLDW